MGGVVDFVIRSTRWSALRRDRAYVADWGAHAGGSPAFVPAPFPLRTQTSTDLNAALVLRIARGRKSGQVRLRGADAADAARCDLSMCIAVDGVFPENLDRAAAVRAVAWPHGMRPADGRRDSER